LLRLPDAVSDLAVAREMAAFGLAPSPLSAWYGAPASAQSGLLLGIAASPLKHIAAASKRFCTVLDRFGPATN